MKEKAIILILLGLVSAAICLAYFVNGNKFGFFFFLPAYACIEEAVKAWKGEKSEKSEK